MSNVYELRPRQPEPTHRDRRHYEDLDQALTDAARLAADVTTQLETALIPDPADVRFVAARLATLIDACLDVLHRGDDPQAGDAP